MKITARHLLAALAAAACTQGYAQDARCKTSDTPECRAQREANCRKAIEEYQQVIGKAPTGDAKDKQRHEAVQAKMRAAIAEGRAKKVEECTIWGQVMGIAFTQ